MEGLFIILIIAVPLYFLYQSQQTRRCEEKRKEYIQSSEDQELHKLALIIRRYFYYFPADKFRLDGTSGEPLNFFSAMYSGAEDEDLVKSGAAEHCRRFISIHNQSIDRIGDSEIPLGDFEAIRTSITTAFGVGRPCPQPAEPETIALPAVETIKKLFELYAFGDMATDSMGVVVYPLEGLPVPLPAPELRREHLYVVGKTGSGKTTFLERLIYLDLLHSRPVIVMGPEANWFAVRIPVKLNSDSAHCERGFRRR